MRFTKPGTTKTVEVGNPATIAVLKDAGWKPVADTDGQKRRPGRPKKSE